MRPVHTLSAAVIAAVSAAATAVAAFSAFSAVAAAPLAAAAFATPGAGADPRDDCRAGPARHPRGRGALNRTDSSPDEPTATPNSGHSAAGRGCGPCYAAQLR